ncbi:MAG TPA: 4-alpha-glucanotransferase, partial [Nannocystis exedens]|nr:4-alpha-glucanotransferase [Nannocystis exedens]
MDRKLAGVAGVTVPLFSLRTDNSWGVGSIADLPPFAEWIADAGLSLVQLLPIAEGSGTSASPYAALSAFGIDPIYIDVEDLPGLDKQEASTLLNAEDQELLATLRRAKTVDYAAVRRLKRQVLHTAWTAFFRREAENPSALGREFQAFSTEHSDWLDALVLFVAIKHDQEGAPWWQWPPPLRD